MFDKAFALKRYCLVSSVAMTTAKRPGPGITFGSWQIKGGKKKQAREEERRTRDERASVFVTVNERK